MLRPLVRFGLTLSLSFIAMASSYAQAATPSSRTTKAEAEAPLVRLSGTVHPLARPENDRGAVPDSFPASRMLVLLNPPADRQQALHAFCATPMRRVRPPITSGLLRNSLARNSARATKTCNRCKAGCSLTASR